MDKVDSKNQSIKITFLEISPPINELIKNKEEINIIFQGHDNFYDFKKYFSSKIPIQLIRYKKSLIMTLLKSNNILATGLFTIRPGEQNVIFNYESKKKIASPKTVNINNLLDCIKIKILCEFDNKDKDMSSNINTNSNLTENSNNNSSKKYVPKVNLMKPNNPNKNKNNNIGKKLYEKKKKTLGNISNNNNNNYKKSFVSSSQEFPPGGEYNAYLTEDVNNTSLKQNSNFNLNDIKKINPYFSSKAYSNVARKTEVEMNSKGKALINKAKSKNNFSTIKRQNKQNFGSHIKLNNSSLNLINQKNNLNSIDKNEYSNINNNSITNRIIKPTTSFNKTNKRNNINKTNILSINSNKNLLNSIDNFISGQIVEHFDKSKKETVLDKNKTNSEKKNFACVNKNINNIGVNLGFNNINNDNKKRKFNNNNITMNSISTAGTKKNELEFSINSLFDCKDYEDKNNNNKNNAISFSNRLNNERLQNKLNENNNNNINININKHKFNKSLCQQSFIDKIFNENDLSINLNKNEKNNISNICKSDKIKDDNNKFNSLNISENINIEKNNDKEKSYTNKENIINNNNNLEIKEFEEEDNLEMDNYLLLKEDFNLLYNDDYIKQINEDLLKLEFELFFEKTAELFSAYHLLMDEKILENQIIKRDYKQNIGNYLAYIKLNNKLQFVKAQQQTKQYNLKDKGINLDKQNMENININVNELNIFKLIFPDENENKCKKLKQIISILMKKKENKELLDEKLKMFLK